MSFKWLRRCHAKDQWSGYLFACALVAAAQAGQYLFKNYWQSGHTHVLLYYLSLAIAAWYGGGRAGLLATMLGTLSYVYHSFGSSGQVDIALTMLFIATGIITSLLFESVARAEAAARLADRRKDEFLATLAHELRNPLAPISNAMEILRTTKDDATRQKVTGIIERQVRQMTQLVDDLMDVERIAQDKIVLRKKPVRLMAAINSAADSVKTLITEKKHALLVSVPPQPVWLDGDMTRLTQILANVLNNAAKYTEPGGTIKIDATMDGDLAKIDISDTGIGIAPDMMPRIFEMFAQTHGTSGNRKSGIGIGLALVRKLVELHGGSIRAHSAGLGKGSQFTILLPTTTEGASAASERQPALRADTDHRRVLVVDDSIDSAQTLSWMLERKGFTVEMAHDGPTAIKMAEPFRPEIILLDIGMPVMDGYKVCETLRRVPALKGTLIVAQTGYGQQADRQRSREAGFDAHLVKPVSTEALQKVIDAHSLPGGR